MAKKKELAKTLEIKSKDSEANLRKAIKFEPYIKAALSQTVKLFVETTTNDLFEKCSTILSKPSALIPLATLRSTVISSTVVAGTSRSFSALDVGEANKGKEGRKKGLKQMREGGRKK